jgi:hypothetical protein
MEQVCMTVFSCLVNGLPRPNPSRSAAACHAVARKNARRPEATLSAGMTPTVRLSRWITTQSRVPSTAATATPRRVSCSRHGGADAGAYEEGEGSRSGEARGRCAGGGDGAGGISRRAVNCQLLKLNPLVMVSLLFKKDLESAKHAAN